MNLEELVVSDTRCLLRIRGVYSVVHTSIREEYVLEVYGGGAVHEFAGRQEFKEYVAVLTWQGTAHAGPAKDETVLRRELPPVKYRLTGKPEKLADNASRCAVRPIFS